MRLHRVRFKHPTRSTEDEVVRAFVVRDLMTVYGCYLERVANSSQQWIAHYA